MKPLVLLDIDGTVFDSTVFVALVNQAYVREFSLTIAQIEKVKSIYYATLEKSTDFDPYAFANHLAITLSLPFAKVYDLYWNTAAFYHDSLFPDVSPFLAANRQDVTFGIFSEGVSAFQRNKLEKSGLLPLLQLDEIHIFHRKLTDASLEKLPRQAIIIDNMEDIVQTLRKKGFSSIWINRREEGKNTAAAGIIHTLSDAATSLQDMLAKTNS